MDKKKLSSVLKLSAFFLAVITLFSFFIPALKETSDGQWMAAGSIFEYIFKYGEFSEQTFKYNAIYIVAFVLAILAILALGYMLVANLMNKSNVKLNKYLIIGSIVCLFVIGVFCFCFKAVMVGEAYQTGLPSPMVEEIAKHMHLYAGSVIPGLFGILGAGALGASIYLDK